METSSTIRIGARGSNLSRRQVDEVRRALLAFARELERRLPNLVTTKWWKEERTGIFIDFNQMARDKTISSAYGVRPTGFVSAPFRWDELDTIEIEDFPLDRFAEDRYSVVGDLTAGIDQSTSRIDTLLQWVVRDHEEFGVGDAPWPPHYPKQPGEPPRVQPSKQRRPDETDLDEVEDLYLYRRLGGLEAARTGRSAEDDLMDLFAEAEVKDAVEQLPDNFRMAVLLADVEGFSYKEIAEIMDIPIGTVMSRLHRGRKLLEKLLYDFAVSRRLAEPVSDTAP